MVQEIVFPDAGELAGWTRERCRQEQTRLRNELSFIHGDRAHGGPAREELRVALLSRLVALTTRLTSDGLESLFNTDRPRCRSKV
jgi:hypothetical protein